MNRDEIYTENTGAAACGAAGDNRKCSCHVGGACVGNGGAVGESVTVHRDGGGF